MVHLQTALFLASAIIRKLPDGRIFTSLTGRPRRFDYLDGVNGIPSEFSGNPSVAKAADGMLYFVLNERAV